MKRKMVWPCMLGIALIIFWGEIHADIVKLKDGSWIAGKIIAETDNIVIIRTEDEAQKIYRKNIQEVIKGKHIGTEAETTKNRFRINDIGRTPISDLESDIDTYMQKLEPLHQRQMRKFSAAQKAARLDEMEAVYVWLSEWCKKGFLLMGIDSLNETDSILGQCQTKFGKDIDLLSKRYLCRDCHGSGYKDCRKCGGQGTIEQYKKLTLINLKGAHKKITKKTRIKCPACKGKGKESCIYDGERWHLYHEPENRMKKIGGLDKMVEIEVAIRKHRFILNIVKNEVRQSDPKRIRKLAEQCRQERYYYLTLQILQRLNGKTTR